MTKEKILIIEDDHDIAVMLQEMMSEQGYCSVIAYDGMSGLDLAQQERPDLILLDLRLPRMNGVQLLTKLHERKLDIPVVVVTAWGSEELALHALRMGVKDYIKKPFDVGELWEVVERTLSAGRLRRENTRLCQDLRDSRDKVAQRSTDLKKMLSKLIRLQRIALALGTLTLGSDLGEVFKRLTEYAVLLLETRCSAVLLFDPQRQELVCQDPAFGLRAGVVRDYRIPLTPVNPLWSAWENGQSLTVNDLAGSSVDEVLGLGEMVAHGAMHSTMFAALRLGGRSIGLFQVADKLDGSPFNADDQRLLEIFASQSAIAIENARLFSGEKRRASEMETLIEIAQATTEGVTEHPKALLERIARGACEVLRADSVVLYPFDACNPEVYDVANVATCGTLHPLSARGRVLADDPLHVIRQRNPLLCEDITRDQPDLLQQPSFKQESVRAFAGVLLEVDEQEMGVLYINYRGFHVFSERELTLVRLVAHQAALAIAKSRQFETLNRDLLRTNADLRRKLQELQEQQKITDMISSTLDSATVFDEILQAVVSIIGAPSAGILVLDKENNTLISRLRQGNYTIAEKIDLQEADIPLLSTAEQRPIIVQDISQLASDDSPWLPICRRLVPDACSFLHVPIANGEKKQALGLLTAGSPLPGQFGREDLRLLGALADQAAIAIQNAHYLRTVRVYQEQQVAAEQIAAIADVARNMVEGISSAAGAIDPLIQQIEKEMDQGKLNEGYLSDMLQRIGKHADHTLEVVQQIQRPFQWLTLEPVDVNESIAAAWAALKAPLGVKVRIEYGKNLPLIRATRQLDEVFRNLMKNALEAMSKSGGMLWVHSRVMHDRRIEVLVQDTGPGIAPEIRDKIFHMGTTNKPGRTGLGLWWSRIFLRRLGGDVTLDPQSAAGCVFRVVLPAIEE